MDEIVISVKNLNMAYSDSPVITNVNLEIRKGSKTAVIGPNGAGKSTLIKGILNIMKPVSGDTLLFGLPVKESFRRISYVPQSSGVHWNFPTTVIDVVMMGCYIEIGPYKPMGKEIKRKALQVLSRVEMEDYANRHISKLSGGQKQRVFLARSIIQNSDIYILDEPLAGIDLKTEKLIMGIIDDFAQEGKTVLVVHHDLASVKEYFDHVIILNKKIVSAGPVETAFTKDSINTAYESRIGDLYGF